MWSQEWLLTFRIASTCGEEHSSSRQLSIMTKSLWLSLKWTLRDQTYSKQWRQTPKGWLQLDFLPKGVISKNTVLPSLNITTMNTSCIISSIVLVVWKRNSPSSADNKNKLRKDLTNKMRKMKWILILQWVKTSLTRPWPFSISRWPKVNFYFYDILVLIILSYS